MSRRSRALGRLRLLLLYLFLAALILSARPTPGLLFAGAAIAFLGEALRCWAAGHLDKSVRLVVSGPYAYTQNPLYLGRLLILTGVALAARAEHYVNLIALALGYAVFFLYYLPRKVRVEGERLRSRHGAAFEAYRTAVPVLLPSLRPYRTNGSAWSLSRMLRNQEIFVLAGLLAAFAVLALRTIGS